MKNLKKLTALFLAFNLLFVSAVPAQQEYPEAKKLSEEEFDQLRKQICGVIIMADTGGFDDKRFINMIAKALGLDLNDSQLNQKVSKFFNQYKNKLICPGRSTSVIPLCNRPNHLFKYAVLFPIMDFYDEILFNKEAGFNIDFNAYEIVDGKKETIVDFLEKMVATNEYDNDTLLLLRDDIMDFGGKRGADLE